MNLQKSKGSALKTIMKLSTHYIIQHKWYVNLSFWYPFALFWDSGTSMDSLADTACPFEDDALASWLLLFKDPDLLILGLQRPRDLYHYFFAYFHAGQEEGKVMAR